MAATVKLPVMLLHGFHGAAHHWTASGFLDALLARGLDPALVHIFSYGYREVDGHPIYDTEGDVRQTASRLSFREGVDRKDLESQVDRLSQESVAAGGPAGVTLICHSMGGLVARYYLSRRKPDEFGTLYRGNVARVIEIGVPNLGVDLARIIALIPADSIIWRVVDGIERLLGMRQATVLLEQLEREVERLQVEVRAAQLGPRPLGYQDSVALRQIMPGSDFLRTLNEPHNTPRDVEFHAIYGDIRLGVSVVWGAVTLWARSVSFGDLLVPVSSASQVPGAHLRRYPFNWEREWVVRLGRAPLTTEKALQQYLPPVSHSNLVGNPDIHQLVWEILTGLIPSDQPVALSPHPRWVSDPPEH